MYQAFSVDFVEFLPSQRTEIGHRPNSAMYSHDDDYYDPPNAHVDGVCEYNVKYEDSSAM